MTKNNVKCKGINERHRSVGIQACYDSSYKYLIKSKNNIPKTGTIFHCLFECVHGSVVRRSSSQAHAVVLCRRKLNRLCDIDTERRAQILGAHCRLSRTCRISSNKYCSWFFSWTANHPTLPGQENLFKTVKFHTRNEMLPSTAVMKSVNPHKLAFIMTNQMFNDLHCLFSADAELYHTGKCRN